MKLQFPTTETVMNPPKGARLDRPAEWVVVGLWRDFERRGMPSAVTGAVKAYAEINHGRWIVECPWCPSAVIPSPEDRRFFCIECENAAVGGKWVEVVWPSEEVAAQVEIALSVRPNPANRNWKAGEPPSNLRDENARASQARPPVIEVPYVPEGYDDKGRMVPAVPPVDPPRPVTR